MRCFVLQEGLDKALKQAFSGVLTAKQLKDASLPAVYQDVGLVADEDGLLHVYATDGKKQTVASVPARVEVPGAFHVHAATLKDMVNLLSPERVDIEVLPSGNALQLKCGATTSRHIGAADFGPDSFPAFEHPLAAVKGAPVFSIPLDLFRAAGKPLLAVASKKASEAATPFSTIALKPVEGGVDVVAADGYRASIVHWPGVELPGGQFQVERSDWDEALRALNKTKSSRVEFYVTQDVLYFKAPDGPLAPLFALPRAQKPDFPEIHALFPSPTGLVGEIRLHCGDLYKVLKSAAAIRKGMDVPVVGFGVKGTELSVYVVGPVDELTEFKVSGWSTDMDVPVAPDFSRNVVLNADYLLGLFPDAKERVECCLDFAFYDGHGPIVVRRRVFEGPEGRGKVMPRHQLLNTSLIMPMSSQSRSMTVLFQHEEYIAMRNAAESGQPSYAFLKIDGKELCNRRSIPVGLLHTKRLARFYEWNNAVWMLDAYPGEDDVATRIKSSVPATPRPEAPAGAPTWKMKVWQFGLYKWVVAHALGVQRRSYVDVMGITRSIWHYMGVASGWRTDDYFYIQGADDEWYLMEGYVFNQRFEPEATTYFTLLDNCRLTSKDVEAMHAKHRAAITGGLDHEVAAINQFGNEGGKFDMAKFKHDGMWEASLKRQEEALTTQIHLLASRVSGLPSGSIEADRLYSELDEKRKVRAMLSALVYHIIQGGWQFKPGKPLEHLYYRSQIEALALGRLPEQVPVSGNREKAAWQAANWMQDSAAWAAALAARDELLEQAALFETVLDYSQDPVEDPAPAAVEALPEPPAQPESQISTEETTMTIDPTSTDPIIADQPPQADDRPATEQQLAQALALIAQMQQALETQAAIIQTHEEAAENRAAATQGGLPVVPGIAWPQEVGDMTGKFSKSAIKEAKKALKNAGFSWLLGPNQGMAYSEHVSADGLIAFRIYNKTGWEGISLMVERIDPSEAMVAAFA